MILINKTNARLCVVVLLIFLNRSVNADDQFFHSMKRSSVAWQDASFDYHTFSYQNNRFFRFQKNFLQGSQKHSITANDHYKLFRRVEIVFFISFPFAYLYTWGLVNKVTFRAVRWAGGFESLKETGLWKANVIEIPLWSTSQNRSYDAPYDIDSEKLKIKQTGEVSSSRMGPYVTEVFIWANALMFAMNLSFNAFLENKFPNQAMMLEINSREMKVFLDLFKGSF